MMETEEVGRAGPRAKGALSSKEQALKAVQEDIQTAVTALVGAAVEDVQSIPDHEFEEGAVTRVRVQRIVESAFARLQWVDEDENETV